MWVVRPILSLVHLSLPLPNYAGWQKNILSRCCCCSSQVWSLEAWHRVPLCNLRPLYFPDFTRALYCPSGLSFKRHPLCSLGMEIRFYPSVCTRSLVRFGPGLANYIVIIQFSMSFTLSLSFSLSFPIRFNSLQYKRCISIEVLKKFDNIRVKFEFNGQVKIHMIYRG